MSLDKATVLHIARLARIALKEDEVEPLAGEFVRHPGIRRAAFGSRYRPGRADDERGRDGLAPARRRGDRRPTRAEAALADAPEREDGFFVVPKVVE